MKANVQKKKITGNGFLLLITIALFVVMYVAGMIVFADKGFAKPQMFLNLFVSNAGLLVIACGLTIVMITGGIDISVGSVTALVCMVLADLMENKGVNAYAAVLVALLIGVAFGIVQGFLVAYLDIQPFIVTLAGMFFGRGLTAIISTDMISIKNELFLKWANYRFYMPFGSTSKKGKFIPAYIPPTVVIALIVVILIAVLLKYRKFGRKLYAIGGSRQSALMMGLNVKKTIFNAYVLDGFLAGLGGFLFCLNSCAGFVEQAMLHCRPERGLLSGEMHSLRPLPCADGREGVPRRPGAEPSLSHILRPHRRRGHPHHLPGECGGVQGLFHTFSGGRAGHPASVAIQWAVRGLAVRLHCPG